MTYLLFPRRCDSRNLNLSPFCGLGSSSASLVKLEPTVRAAYGGSSIEAGYVQDLASPMRKEYPNGMASDEILSVLAKVVPNHFIQHPIAQKNYHILGYNINVYRMILSTTHTRETLLLSTFSFLTQQCLVRFKIILQH